MRILIRFIILVTLLSGCASIQRVMNRDHMSDQDRREKAAREEAEKAEEDAAYLKDLNEIKAENPQIDFDAKDSNGETIEYRVLKYAEKNEIRTIKWAFLKYIEWLNAEKKKQEIEALRAKIEKKRNDNIMDIVTGVSKYKKGTKAASIRKRWGEPDETYDTEQLRGELYDHEVKPIIFVYELKTKNLVKWLVDEDRVKRRIAERERQEILAAQRRELEELKQLRRDLEYQKAQVRREQAEADYRQAWQNLGSTLQNINTQNQLNRIEQNQNYQRAQPTYNGNGRVPVNMPNGR